MWSYKYTSSASVFVDQCRIGVRFEAATSTSQLVSLFDAVTKEQVRENNVRYLLLLYEQQPIIYHRK